MVTPHEPSAGNSWEASAAPNWSDTHEPMIIAIGIPEPEEGAVRGRAGEVVAEEVTTSRILSRDPAVQRYFVT
ncbi:hypothetical protein GCM10027268_22870 [Brachybacterium huguangmaarense]